MSEPSELHLKEQLTGLLRYINRVRQEIAAIDRPADEEHQFVSMGEQLDAIVQATEKATNNIMEAMERNEEAIGQIRGLVDDAAVHKLLEQMSNNGNEVFEACSFQDITGQRVNKVVKSVTYVEERVNALVGMWGKEELSKVIVKGTDKTDDEKLLEGPQMEGKGLSQDDIDSLFD